MQRGKLKKTLAAGLSAVMTLGTSLNGVILPVMAEESLPDPALVPKPLSYESTDQVYTMGEDVRIVVVAANEDDSRALHSTADLLAARFRRSTGYAIPVIEGESTAGDIVLKTNEAKEELGEEGYTIEAAKQGIEIEAFEPAGVYNGTQTLRQMFSADIEKQEAAEDGVWKVKAASVYDKPEYSYRGMHLDVSRHFFTVDQVKRQMDLISQFKINKLHMHLSDDQGWRLEIKDSDNLEGWDMSRLKTIGAATSCSINGRNPGQYTQEEFKELVRYAAERNIEIIPEFDMPAHAWAALVSLPQLNSTEDGLPHAGNYDNTQCYEGIDVGWASLETHNENTYKFIDEVVRQVSAISPSEIIHLGGDEAHSTARTDYAYFMNRVVEIGKKYGKKVMGWENLDEVAEDKENTITQFWSTGNAKMTAGVNYVCSVADHAYMDMKYDAASEYGLTWATYNPVDDSYNWDPTNYGTKDQILGVEACLWTETVNDDHALDYMIYPRIAGHAEIGWTPKADREWSEYKGRIAQFDTRLVNEGVDLRRDEIIWPEPYEPVNAYYPLEEAEGNTVLDSEGMYPGTISGNAAWVDGVKGKAFHFDGATCIDINHKDMQGPWTASMWVSREASTGTNAVLLSGTEGEIKLDQWNKTGKVGLTKFGVKDWTFNYSAPLNEWVHLAFVCNESTTTLYVNGVKTETISASIKGPFSRIGHCAKSDMESTGFMSGALDEIRVYNDALSDEQIASVYAMDSETTKEDLQKVIDQAEALSEASYTASTWSVLAAALANAKTVAAKEDASSEEISEALSALQNAIKGLEASVAPGSIRIASYNIAANRHPDLQAMNSQLKANAVTIAGIQEVDVNTGRNSFDMLERIASYGTYPYTHFQKAIDYSGGQYGIGVISTLDLTDTDGGALVSEGIDEARAWTKVVVEKDGYSLSLYNTHLTHEKADVRAQQMAQLLEIVKNDPAEYKAVTGDFNTELGVSEWMDALKDFDLANGYDGTWLKTCDGMAIDNVIVTRNLRVKDVFMVENSLSDHNMLVAELEFLDEAEVSTQYLDVIVEQALALDSKEYTEASYDALMNAVSAALALDETASQADVNAAAQAIAAAMDALEKPVIETVYINDSETGTALNQFNFSAGWKTSVNYPDLFYGGDEHWVNFSSYSGTEMPYFTIDFEGTGIEIYGNHHSMMGIYEVTIDDGEPAEADAYAPERQTQSLLFSARDLTPGRHTIKVSATGRKNASSSSTDIEVDYAIVYNEQKAEEKDTTGIRKLLLQAILNAETITGSDDFAKLAPAVQSLLTLRLAEAHAAYDDHSASFDTLAQAWKNLAAAIHYADFAADKTDLKKRIDQVEAMDLDGYTEESRAALEEALAAAKAVYEDENALQERIDQALADLNAAAASLEEVPAEQADKTLLALLIAQADKAYGEEDKYLQNDAWTAFLNELASAKDVYSDAAASQAEVNAALSSLSSAYLSIRLVPDEAVLAALNDFVSASAAVTESLYSKEELAAIKQARKETLRVLADKNTDQDAAKDQLETVAPLAALILEREGLHAPAANANASVSSQSVKTAASSHTGSWMMAAAGAAVLAVLSSKKKRDE